MAPYWEEHWGNPSSRQHRLGLTASAAVNLARQQLQKSLALRNSSLVFTSGATEANNLALLGRARHHGQSGHLISVSTEHHAVLDPLRQLQREGFRVTLLSPGRDGLITPDQLLNALEPDTFLVSVMAANNEIGVLQPLQALCAFVATVASVFTPMQPRPSGTFPEQAPRPRSCKPQRPPSTAQKGWPLVIPPLLWGGAPSREHCRHHYFAAAMLKDLKESTSRRTRLLTTVEGLQHRMSYSCAT